MRQAEVQSLHLPGAELGSELAPLVGSEGALRDARDSDAAAQLVDARLQQLAAAGADHPCLHLAILQGQRVLRACAPLACMSSRSCVTVFAHKVLASFWRCFLTKV